MSKKNKSIFFSLSFLICFTCIFIFVNHKQKKNKEQQAEKIEMVLNDFKGHFENFVGDLISNGIITSEYFSHGTINQHNYEDLMGPIARDFIGIYGINLLDKKGEIIRVYPYETNKLSLGRITQNYSKLVESHHKKERYWLSPPFHLFQGPLGFVIYLPIIKENELIGWIAPVVSVKTFFKSLKEKPALNELHIIIQDVESKKNYLNTNQYLEIPHRALWTRQEIKGRKIAIISWPKSRFMNMDAWPFSLSFSFFISLFFTYFYILFERQSKVSMAGSEIDSLIKFSLREASNGGMFIQHQLELLQSAPEFTSIDRIKLLAKFNTTLLTQIGVLKKILNEEESKNLSKIQLIPFMSSLPDLLRDILSEKELHLTIHPGEAAGCEFMANEWLISNTVFDALLAHAITFASPESTIGIENKIEKDFVKIMIKNENVSQDYSTVEDSSLERSMLVVKKVLKLMHGDLTVKKNKTGDFFFTVHLLKNQS